MDRLRALVVDDSKTSRGSLKKAIEKLDVHVDCVESGENALEYLKLAYPDLIFMDQQMAGLSGVDTIRRIKENQKTSGINITVVSGYEDSKSQASAITAGADGVLVKPAFSADIRQIVEKIQRKKNGGIDREELQNYCAELVDSNMQFAEHRLQSTLAQELTVSLGKDLKISLKKGIETAIQGPLRQVDERQRQRVVNSERVHTESLEKLRKQLAKSNQLLVNNARSSIKKLSARIDQTRKQNTGFRQAHEQSKQTHQLLAKRLAQSHRSLRNSLNEFYTRDEVESIIDQRLQSALAELSLQQATANKKTNAAMALALGISVISLGVVLAA